MDKLVVFKGKNIRRTLYKGEWWFSVVDVVEVLTDSNDPKQYIKRMRSRDQQLNINWGTICTSPPPYCSVNSIRKSRAI